MNHQELVYIHTPFYSNKINKDDVKYEELVNVDYAKRLAKRVIYEDGVPVIPHILLEIFDSYSYKNRIYIDKQRLLMLEACDKVYMCGFDIDVKDCDANITEYANVLGLPIYEYSDKANILFC